MENKDIKDEYCKEFGYGSFNKFNESEYSKWLEKELLKARHEKCNICGENEADYAVCHGCRHDF